MPSSKAAAEAALKGWVKVVWDQGTKVYKIEQASKGHGQPTWPFSSFEDLLDVALTNRILADPDSEVVQKILAKKRKGRKQ